MFWMNRICPLQPNGEALPIPTGRLASVTIFIEKAKSSRLLVNRQKALNSSNVMLWKGNVPVDC